MRLTHTAGPRAPPTTAPIPPYDGPTQTQSSSNIVTSKQTLVTILTSQALILGEDMINLENDQLPAGSSARKNASTMDIDSILADYYTWGAAYNFCRFLSFHLNFLLETTAHNATTVAEQFRAAIEDMWDSPNAVLRTERNATCNLSAGSVGVSFAILTEVPQLNRSYYPPTFSVFIMGHGSWGASINSLISASFSNNYVAGYRPFDLVETLGFLGLVYKSPAAPTPTTVTVYAITKDSAFSSDGGVAIWTFLMVQVIALCTAVVIGMTIVRWVIKPPSLPPLKEYIMRGGSDNSGIINGDGYDNNNSGGESGSFVGVVGSFNNNNNNNSNSLEAQASGKEKLA